MPDCFVDMSLVVAAALCWWRAKGAREKERRERFKVVSRISQHVLGRAFSSKDWSSAAQVHGQLPLGADSGAAAALRDVQRYQERRRAQSAEALSVPACSVGLLSFGGCSNEPAGPDVETAVCEDLKVWLLSAATGGASADEVASRLDFYRQLLMRPETFSDAAFLNLLATVCERLDELLGRLAGSVRSCAIQLGRVLSSGRELLEGLLPVLLLAITDPLAADGLPHLSAEGLISSALAWRAARAAAGGGAAPAPPPDVATVGDPFAALWEKDSGRILAELLLAPHLFELLGLEPPGPPRGGAGAGAGVLDEWLLLRHKWMDAVDAGQPLHGSGLHHLFRASGARDVQQVYLDLYKQIDNMVKFLSMVLHYRRLATIAGDAGMHHLRDRLHHLLQEIELSAVQVLHGVSRLTSAVQRTVVDLTISEPNPAGRRRAWIEKLKYIDESVYLRSYRGLLEAIQQVRYLSSEARLPALQASCRESLEQIALITASPEFRLRCADAPPAEGLAPPAILDAAPAPAPAAAAAAATAASEAGPGLSHLPPAPAPAAPPAAGAARPVRWSVERQLRAEAGAEEAAAAAVAAAVAPLRRASASELGEVVGGLNSGAIPEPGDVCVVFCESSGERIALFAPGCESAALEALGLEAGPRPLRTVAPLVAETPAAAAAGGGDGEAMRDAEPAAEQPWPRKEAAYADGKSDEERAREQAAYYAVLFNAVFPFLAEGPDYELLPRHAAKALLERAELPDETLEAILDLELGTAAAQDEARIGAEALARLGRLVAACQERGLSARNQVAQAASSRALPPRAPPQLRGLIWDGHKISVLEPLA